MQQRSAIKFGKCNAARTKDGNTFILALRSVHRRRIRPLSVYILILPAESLQTSNGPSHTCYSTDMNATRAMYFNANEHKNQAREQLVYLAKGHVPVLLQQLQYLATEPNESKVSKH